MSLGDLVAKFVAFVRSGYPHGVPQTDYIPSQNFVATIGWCGSTSVRTAPTRDHLCVPWESRFCRSPRYCRGVFPNQRRHERFSALCSA